MYVTLIYQNIFILSRMLQNFAKLQSTKGCQLNLTFLLGGKPATDGDKQVSIVLLSGLFLRKVARECQNARVISFAQAIAQVKIHKHCLFLGKASYNES